MARKKKPKPAQPKTAADVMIERKVVTVEDPEFSTDHEEGKHGNRRFQPAMVNVRESAVETLYHRKFLGSAQKAAADKLNELWIAAGGKMSSLDYTADRVDGASGDPAAHRLIAAQELRRVRYLVGHRGFENLQAVCCEGKALTELSPHKRDRLTMADNLRADLDECASLWGLQTRRRQMRRAG